MKIILIILSAAMIRCSVTAQDFKRIGLISRPYKVVHEDSLQTYMGFTGKISADLKLQDFGNLPHFSEIEYCEGKLKGDTLLIIITGGSVVFHEYKIEIIKDQCRVKYSSLQSGGIKAEIKCDDFKVDVNSREFKIGKEIRGATEFHGKCEKGCIKTKIDIKGNFKLTISSINEDDNPAKWRW